MLLNRLLYSALFVVSFVFVYFYGGKMPFMLFYILLTLPVLSFAYAFLTYKRFNFGQELDKHMVTKGTALSYSFFLENTSPFFFPFIKIKFFSTASMGNDVVEDTYSLPPGAVERHAVELPCRYRGRYDVGIQKIEVLDMLGLLSLSRPVPEPQYVIVYPRVIPLARFRTTASNVEIEIAAKPGKKSNSSNVISEIREYRYGDSMKNIHWKLSSKTGKLLVKSYDGASEAGVNVFMDLSLPPLEFAKSVIFEDKLIEAAVAIINYCVSRNISVRVVYDAGSPVEKRISGNYEFNLLLKDLAEIPFQSETSMARLLGSHVSDFVNKTDLVIITGKPDGSLYERICQLAGAGYNVIPVYVSPAQLTGEEPREAGEFISGLADAGIYTYRIDINDDIKSVLEK